MQFSKYHVYMIFLDCNKGKVERGITLPFFMELAQKLIMSSKCVDPK